MIIKETRRKIFFLDMLFFKKDLNHSRIRPEEGWEELHP